VFPVLADGVLSHTDVFPGTQSFQVTLPSDVTCTHCTLQVLEFMSSHPAPCFYHHCADISIGPASPACGSDADCADENACTRDACGARQQCLSQPLTLADVTAGFLGVVDVPACSTERVPRVVGRLFGTADTLVTRAAQTPAKAARILDRAAKRLRRAATKVEKARGRRISAECGTALAAGLDQARTRVQCLRGDG